MGEFEKLEFNPRQSCELPVSASLCMYNLNLVREDKNEGSFYLKGNSTSKPKGRNFIFRLILLAIYM